MRSQQPNNSGTPQIATVSPYQNIVALFGKVLDSDASKTEAPDAFPIGGKWIVLGCFDTLQFYPLSIKESESWITAMWEYNVSCSATLKGDFYYHPLHLNAIISEKELDRYRNFWEAADQPFVFLTMVQALNPPLILEQTEKEQKLKNGRESPEDSQKGAEDSISDRLDALLGFTQERGGVQHIFYQTMELSDLVILWRSDDFHKILEQIHALYHHPKIGDLNIFPAIQYSYLENLADDPSSDDTNDQSIFVSSQYTVRAPREAQEFFTRVPSLDNHAYFSTGMEDFRIISHEVYPGELLRYLKKSLIDPINRELFNKAFVECATHIGILDSGSPPALQRDGRLEEICRTLLINFQALRESMSGENYWRDYSWSKAVSNLLNALVDMSRNCVMDGFCYLTIDAARLFCDEVSGMYEGVREESLPFEQLEGIQRFVRGWGTLMEQVTKMDRRLLQMPGLSPALCEIPARLLEFYLAFSRRCIHIMQADDIIDVSVPRRISLMFLPKICRRVKVNSIFAEDQRHDHLLYVDIPLDHLYTPMETLCCLTHEVAHYAGESWRNREARRFHLLLVFSIEFATYLRVDTETPIRHIYEQLKEACKNLEPTASALIEESYVAMLKIAANELGALLNEFKTDINKARDEVVVSRLHDLQTESVLLARQFLLKKSHMEDIIKNLVYLFKECYADLNMIALLGLTPKEYICMAKHELDALRAEEATEGAEQAEETDPLRRNSQYYVIVERWAALLSVKTLWDSKDEPSFNETEMLLHTFYEDILTRLNTDNQNFLSNKNQPNYRYYFTKGTFQQLKSYLTLCTENIKKSQVEEAGRKLVRTAFQCMSAPGALNGNCCEELIFWNRQDLLSKASPSNS